MKNNLLLWLIICWIGTTVPLAAQDPFFAHFYGNESTYNPALTGYRGALSLIAKHKSQWPGLGENSFRTTNLLYEESLPCSIFDWGLSFRSDREGDGLFKTMDLGFRFAGTIPFDWGDSRHNIRLGGGFQWSYKGVDYSRLSFSDEIDAKYGFVLPTNFQPPNNGESLWYFSPSVGFSHRFLVNSRNSRSSTVHYGAAIHNAYGIGNRPYFGNEESVLQIGTKLTRRVSFFGTYEFISYLVRGTFIAIKPTILYENQGGIQYWEVGSKFSLNRTIAVGAYYHTSVPPEQGNNTNWLSFNVELGRVLGKNHRIDIGFSYSENLSGLRNALGPMLEMTFAVHFADSPSCRWGGRGDEIPYGPRVKCPTSAQTPGRRKLYEGIWYRNN